MPFSALGVRGFQAHRKIDVEFDPNLTTIVGPSDVGKSSLLRAVRWICLNQPQGEGNINSDSQKSECILMFDQHEVTRLRSRDGENTYKLDGQDFKSFGFGVPDTISKLLAVSEINFSDQHDPAFWFSLSAPDVSRELNHVVDLGIIDETLQRIGVKVKACKDLLKVTQVRLSDVRNKRDAAAWVIECKDQYESTRKIQIELDSVSDKKNSLERHLDGLRETHRTGRTAAERLRDAEEIERHGTRWVEKYGELTSLECASTIIIKSQEIANAGCPDFSELGSLKESFEKIQSKRTLLENAADLAEKAKTKAERETPDISKLIDHVEVVERIHKKIQDYRNAIDSCELSKDELEIRTKRFDENTLEFEKETAGRCPVCGTEGHTCDLLG